MKNDHEENNKSYDTSEDIHVIRRTVVLFAVCVGALLLFSSIDTVKNMLMWILGIISPILIGIMLAVIVNPLNIAVEKLILRLYEKHGNPQKTNSHANMAHIIGVTVSILTVVAALSLLLTLIIPEFFSNLIKFIEKIPPLLHDLGDWLESKKISDSVFMENFDKYIDELIDSFASWFTGEFATAIAGVIESLYSVVLFIVDFFISLVVCVYALLEKKKFVSYGKKIVFAFFSPDVANDILDIARYGNDVFGKFLSGKIITSAIVGIATFIFMQIMGMPYSIIVSVFVAFTNIIPYFGPFIGGIPTAFIILITDVRQGIIYIIFLLILQQIEGNIIEPKIMEDKTGVSKFWITFALLLFGGVFGLFGMILAVPIFAVLFYSLRKYVSRRLKAKNYPSSGSEYYNVSAVDPETGEFIMRKEEPSVKRKFKFKQRFSKCFIKKKNKNENSEENGKSDK